MDRRSLGSAIAVTLVALTLLAVPVAGLAATDGGTAAAVQDNETTDDGMNDSESMDNNETMDDDGMDDNESMNEDEEMDDESEGGTLDGLGVAAAVLALAALVGVARLR